MKLLIIGLIGSLFITIGSGQTIDQSGYLGCYENNKEINDFRTFASHLDPSLVTPQSCVEACSVMGQSLAAIEDGNFCFCKSTEGTNLANTSDSNCLALPCPGDASLACGSNNHLIVYTSSSSILVRKIFFKKFQKIIFFKDKFSQHS